MTNDTKFSGTMSNVSKNNQTIDNGDVKNGAEFLATELLDFLMTEDNDFIMTGKGLMTNDIKYG